VVNRGTERQNTVTVKEVSEQVVKEKSIQEHYSLYASTVGKGCRVIIPYCNVFGIGCGNYTKGMQHGYWTVSEIPLRTYGKLKIIEGLE
jgi:hypothetical protein